MKNVITVLVCLVLAGTFLMGQAAVGTLLGTLSSVSATPIYTWGDVATKMTFLIEVTGAPSGCTINIQGTAKASPVTGDMVDISGPITCTGTTTMVHIVDKTVTSVAANLSVLSGGTSPTVSTYFTASK